MFALNGLKTGSRAGARAFTVNHQAVRKGVEIFRQDLFEVGGMQSNIAFRTDIDLTKGNAISSIALELKKEKLSMKVSGRLGAQLTQDSGISPVAEASLEAQYKNGNAQASLAATLDYTGNVSATVKVTHPVTGDLYTLSAKNISLTGLPKLSASVTRNMTPQDALQTQIQAYTQVAQQKGRIGPENEEAWEKKWSQVQKQLDTLRGKQILEPHEQVQFERIKAQAEEMSREEQAAWAKQQKQKQGNSQGNKNDNKQENQNELAEHEQIKGEDAGQLKSELDILHAYVDDERREKQQQEQEQGVGTAPKKLTTREKLALDAQRLHQPGKTRDLNAGNTVGEEIHFDPNKIVIPSHKQGVHRE